MTSPLDQLRALAAPPPAPHPYAWADVHRELGGPLPGDYEALATAYGPGAFDGFIWLLTPHAPTVYLDLRGQRDLSLSGLRQLRDDGEPVPYRVDADDPQLWPWAVTDNGDTCYWVRDPRADPDAWHVAVNAGRDPAWQEFTGSTTAFLVAVLTGAFTSDIFPDTVPSEHPRFTPPGPHRT